jgi:hypothetical protein
MKTRSWRPASSGLRGTVYAVVRQGADDELFSSPASSWQVAFLCGASEGTYSSAKEVLLAMNSGRTEHLTGRPRWQATWRGSPYRRPAPR